MATSPSPEPSGIARLASCSYDTVSLPAHARSAREARKWVGSSLAPKLETDRRHDLGLLISEVMANAIQHGSDDVGIELRLIGHETYVRVEVTNAGAGLAPRPRATEPSSSGGFGLFLVECLTREWGINRQRDRTQVWFEFDYV